MYKTAKPCYTRRENKKQKNVHSYEENDQANR